MKNLKEAKRYVRRYYIKPQNEFASNKDEIIKALIDIDESDHPNCTIYTLNNLGDEKDVTKLTNNDIIYYYDEGQLFDKNRVKIFDYDLAIKHEEKRDNIDPDQVSDATFKDIYDDRMTDATVLEGLKLNEMMANRYQYFVSKIAQEMAHVVADTQKQLDSSTSKAMDFAILSVFYSKLFSYAFDNWDFNDADELFNDSNAMMPMPESVGKQLCAQLFKINNLDPLYDLGINDGFQLIQEFTDDPTETDYTNFYDDCLSYGAELFEDAPEADNEFDLTFESFNAFGEQLHEGKEINGSCCICGEDIFGYGNNAEPYKSGRCCDACNLKFVIPARLEKSKK